MKKGHEFYPPMAFDSCSSDLRSFSGDGLKGHVQKAPQAQNHDQRKKKIAGEKLFHFVDSFRIILFTPIRDACQAFYCDGNRFFPEKFIR
jgi:hypothetical protein